MNEPVTGTVTATDTQTNISELSCTGITLTDLTGVGSAMVAPANFSINAEGTTKISCTAKDSATPTPNESAEETATVKIDTVAPTITDSGPTPTSPNGDNGWYTTAVTNGFAASDDTSGLADCDPTFTKSSDSAEGSSVTIASGPCSDNAGNTNPGITSVAFKIDLSDPYNVAFVGGPADGGSYVFGSVPAAPTCTADDDISGLDDCVVSGYGTSVGSHTMTATATDNAGRTAQITRSYTVLAWDLYGFYRPVDMGIWNTVKGGSTVPLKFNVFAGDTELTDTSAIVGSTAVKSTCPNGSTTTDDIEFTTTGSTSLRYDWDEVQFIRNWKTPKKAGSCYTVTMETLDGSTLTANFILK